MHQNQTSVFTDNGKEGGTEGQRDGGREGRREVGREGGRERKRGEQSWAKVNTHFLRDLPMANTYGKDVHIHQRNTIKHILISTEVGRMENSQYRQDMERSGPDAAGGNV